MLGVGAIKAGWVILMALKVFELNFKRLLGEILFMDAPQFVSN